MYNKKFSRGTHSYMFFPQILKENKHNDLFSKSKKSLLRNTKSDKLYILGMRWIAPLAFVRCVNRRARAIARLLLTGLTSPRTKSMLRKKENLKYWLINQICKDFEPLLSSKTSRNGSFLSTFSVVNFKCYYGFYLSNQNIGILI